MSHSGRRTDYEERQEQQKAYVREGDEIVTCKNLVYLHQTEKAVLVQEGPELAGDEWRKHGKKSWLPKSAIVRCIPSFNSYIEAGDAVEIQIRKRLAEEKEMVYE